MNKDIYSKSFYLKPFEICEYTNICNHENCLGKDKNRETEFSCGLRRLGHVINSEEKRIKSEKTKRNKAQKLSDNITISTVNAGISHKQIQNDVLKTFEDIKEDRIEKRTNASNESFKLTKNQIEVLLCTHSMLNCEECSMDKECDCGQEPDSYYSELKVSALDNLKKLLKDKI